MTKVGWFSLLSILVFPNLTFASIETLRLDQITILTKDDGTPFEFKSTEYEGKIKYLDASMDELKKRGEGDSLLMRTSLIGKAIIGRCIQLQKDSCPMYVPNGNYGSISKLTSNAFIVAPHEIDGLVTTGAIRSAERSYWFESAAIYRVDAQNHSLELVDFYIPQTPQDPGKTEEFFLTSGRHDGIKYIKGTKFEISDYAVLAFDTIKAKAEIEKIEMGKAKINDQVKLILPYGAISSRSFKLKMIDHQGLAYKVPGLLSFLVFFENPKDMVAGRGTSGSALVDTKGHFLGVLVGFIPSSGMNIAISFDPKEITRDW